MQSINPFIPFIKASIKVIGALLIPVYMIGACSSWIHPNTIWGITFLAIGFPLLFLLFLVWCIITFIVFRGKSGLLFVLLLPGLVNLTHLYAFNTAQSFNIKKQEGHIRVLTWNVNEFLFSRPEEESWKVDQQKMLLFIKEMNADILCFQDFIVAPGWAERDIPKFIKDSLGFPYQFFSEDDKDYGTIIFSKFPIQQTGRIIYQQKVRPESIAFADIAIENKVLRVFNTHFRSMFLHYNYLSEQVLGEVKYVKEDTNYLFKSSRLERIAHYDKVHTDQAVQVATAFNQTNTPFIFCADLNAVPASYVYQLLRKQTKDAFLEKGSGIGGTYKKANFLARIDYILTRKDIQVHQYFSPELNLSDHYPVIADISFAH